MSFFAIENIKAIVGGRWLQRAAPTGPLRGVGIDTREDLRQRAFIAIRGERLDGHAFLADAAAGGAALLIIEREAASDGLPPDIGILLVENTRRSLTRLASAYRRHLASTKVIAITGSAGKTTTKRLIHSVLATTMRGYEGPKSFNNEIGVPLTILGATPQDRYALVEVGANAPGEIAHLAGVAQPNIAVITSIGRAHLEGFGSLEVVAREKSLLLRDVQPNGLSIVNADSALLRPHLRGIESVVLFGEAEDADLRLTGRGRHPQGAWWFEVNGRARFRLGLAGAHNAINALAAVAVGRRFGLVDERISAGLAEVEPVPMRMTWQEIGAITVFNDAYNANPDSMRASLAMFAELSQSAERRVLVLGDMLELGAAGPGLHAGIGRAIAELHEHSPIAQVVLVGELAQQMADVLPRRWRAAHVTMIAELTPQAARAIADLLRPGDAVLLKASRGVGLERLIRFIEQREAAGRGRCADVNPQAPVAGAPAG